jgi:hypothetical protein
MSAARFSIELGEETDGRWIAEVLAMPGVLAYGATREEAVARVEALGFVSSPIAWSTEKPCRSSTPSSSLREPVAIDASPKSPCCTLTNWLVREAHDRLAPGAISAGFE